MNKKAGLFIASLLLISMFSFIIPVSAQEEVPGIGEVPFVNETQQIQQQYEQFTTAENKSEYLKQEWEKLLGKHKILGPIIKVVNSILVFLNPFFKIVLGYESSLTWAFFFAISIWLILFFLIGPPLSQIFNSNLFGGLASFAIVSLIGLSGIIRKAVDLLNIIITNRWIFWISLAIAILLIFISNMFGRKIKNWLKKMKKESEEVKTAEAQKIIQTRAESAEKELKSYEEDKK